MAAKKKKRAQPRIDSKASASIARCHILIKEVESEAAAAAAEKSDYDETRYFSMVASLAMVEASPPVRAKVLKRLVEAIAEEVGRGGACRDLDVGAATRARVWETS